MKGYTHHACVGGAIIDLINLDLIKAEPSRAPQFSISVTFA